MIKTLALTATAVIALTSTTANAAFRIYFSDTGVAYYQTYQNGAYGSVVQDNGSLVNGYLTFLLPDTVGSGYVGVTGSGQTSCTASTCVAGLQFGDTLTASKLEYFEPTGGATLASTGFPAGFAPSVYAAVVSGTSFLFQAGSGGPAGTNYYYGTLTGAVPEPETWAMMIAGMGAIGYAIRRRGRHVTARVQFA